MDPTPAERQVEEIDSLCMNCHADGTTRMLLTRIPYFREIILMSFECPHCGFKNAEIQSAGEIQQRGVRFSFRLDSMPDLQRQIVKSDTCVCRVEEIDLEIPSGRGQLTNIEGLLSMVRQDLEAKQPERKQIDEELHSKVGVVIVKLTQMLNGETFPITITLEDPAGNSSVEPSPSDGAGKYSRSEFARNMQQNASLGLADDSANASVEAPPTQIRPEYRANQMFPQIPNRENGAMTLDADAPDDEDIVENQVYSFPATCPGCTKPCATNMKMVRIPHFEQVVVMSTVCEHCGYRSNEVKTGGKIPDKGRRITVRVLNPIDLSRDILKAESCRLACPELSLNVEPGTLGGRFTTVEGLLTQIRDDLRSSIFDTDDTDGLGGDSMDPTSQSKWTAFFASLNKAIAGEMQFTLILEDPLASSYVQSLTAPDPDEQIQVEEYTRTHGEEEDLGLNDIKTEAYGEDEQTIESQNAGDKLEAPRQNIDNVQKLVEQRLEELGSEAPGG